MDLSQEALIFHKKLKGKIALQVKSPIKNRHDLSLAYTPGVAAVSQKIANDKKAVWDYTGRGNWVAVVTDGTAVLGLGDIGPEAAMPVMEGKAVLFKEFANIDAFPLCLDTKDPDQIIAIASALAPSFAGINLEDISAPRCFYIEEKLNQRLSIPVFHDDQHGTAIVVLAGLRNALSVTHRTLKDVTIAISGAGAAGSAIARILISQGVRHIVIADSKGIISSHRGDLDENKKKLAVMTNHEGLEGTLAQALKGRDVFIGVSVPHIVSEQMIRSMNPHPIVFALANPTPEIMPAAAKRAGAAIVATGRSDFPNQVNNVLAFPGVFRGALDAKVPAITHAMKLAAAKALADYVKTPSPTYIIPDALDKRVAFCVAKAVKRAALPL